MDELLQDEKQKYEEQRKRQISITRIIAGCFFAIIIGLGVISLFSLFKISTKQNFITISAIIVICAGLSGLVEYFKVKRLGHSRSIINEIIQLLIFILMALAYAYFEK